MVVLDLGLPGINGDDWTTVPPTTITRLPSGNGPAAFTLVPFGGAGPTHASVLELTNPNQQTTGLFWQDQNDALAGMNAAYNSLQYIGTYGRWMAFSSRSFSTFS